MYPGAGVSLEWVSAKSRRCKPPPFISGETEAQRRKTLVFVQVNGQVFPAWDTKWIIKLGA